VTDWQVIGEHEKGAQEYTVEDFAPSFPAYTPECSNIFAVFTATEVAEKRGRHWVRLPWCSRMQLHEVAEIDPEHPNAAEAFPLEWATETVTAKLTPLPAPTVEGIQPKPPTLEGRSRPDEWLWWKERPVLLEMKTQLPTGQSAIPLLTHNTRAGP
jgi:hypothetical protein